MIRVVLSSLAVRVVRIVTTHTEKKSIQTVLSHRQVTLNTAESEYLLDKKVRNTFSPGSNPCADDFKPLQQD